MPDVTMKINLSPAKTGALYMAYQKSRDRVKEIEAKLKQLHSASERMRSDLLIRGDTEANGTRVVNVSSSVWSVFCDALDEANSK